MIEIPDKLPALTVYQPYAELLARGADAKPCENRKWATVYRGPIAIHAGKSREDVRSWDAADERVYGFGLDAMTFGAITSVGLLVACLYKPPIGTIQDHQQAYDRWPHELRRFYHHEHTEGPICWVIEQMTRLTTPIACRGQQGVWFVEAQHVRGIRKQLDDMKGTT